MRRRKAHSFGSLDLCANLDLDFIELGVLRDFATVGVEITVCSGEAGN
jgi:hypothetical protein